MKDCLRIMLASVVGLMPIKSIQANESNKQPGETQATWQGIQQSGQTGSDADKWPINSLADSYKWAIRPSEDNFKWAVKSSADSASLPLAKLEQSKKSTSYFRPFSSYATQPESDPPRYVRNLSKIGVEGFKDITWLEIGLDHRTRYEFRSNDIRRTDLRLDQPFLLRTRAYLGIKQRDKVKSGVWPVCSMMRQAASFC